MFERPTSPKRLHAIGALAIAIALAAALASANPELSDPTRPPAHAAPVGETRSVDEVGPLVLRAVLFAKGRRVAIINDQRLQENDRIGNARVTRIAPDRVELEVEGKQVTLKMIHHEVKRKRESDWRERKLQ